MYNKIVKMRDDARRNQDKQRLSTLTVILGEIQRSCAPNIVEGEKSFKDTDIIAVIKNLVKNWEASPHKEQVKNDIEIAKTLLPIQLTYEDLIKIIESVAFDNIGGFMHYLKMNYPGQYDGKLAKQLWDESI